jgi:hypothetical protein
MRFRSTSCLGRAFALADSRRPAIRVCEFNEVCRYACDGDRRRTVVRPSELRSNRFFETLAEWNEALGAVDIALEPDF